MTTLITYLNDPHGIMSSIYQDRGLTHHAQEGTMVTGKKEKDLFMDGPISTSNKHSLGIWEVAHHA